MPSPSTPVATPLQTTLERIERTAKVRRRRAKRRRLGIAVIAATTLGAWPLAWSLAATTPAQSSPGSLTGWAFDACKAPSASVMDAWMQDKTNPYRGIGIYISGSLRACSQPNLTPAWVGHVQQTGWHLLPLTVGPQASCTGFSQRISSTSTNTYAAARKQGTTQADDAVTHARAIGINPGSTLFYDMENWHTGYNSCDASSLWFMSAWSNRLHAYGYAGGVYVSGLSGARLLNAMADNKPSGFVLPDQIWVAEWNNQENVRSSYLDAQNWANHQRAHQYYGGHNATNSGITLNIDSNYVDLRPVFPIPAVIPDSAVGAPPPVVPPVLPPTTVPSLLPTKVPSILPTKAPAKLPSIVPTKAPAKLPTPAKTPSVGKPTVAPTLPKTPIPSKAPTVKPSTTPTKAAVTPTAHPTPTVRPSVATPTAVPTPTHIPTPAATPSKTSAPTDTLNTVTSAVGTASGIKLPSLPAAKMLAPKLAKRVPTMVTAAPKRVVKVTTHSRTHVVAQPSAAPTTVAPEPNAANPDAQAAPLQPTLPAPIPATTNAPSLVAQIWHGTQAVLLVIGQGLAAAAGWVGRGFGSMLGW